MTEADSTRYYYYPSCSKDFTFENIFSTESLSPCSFYQTRDFGIQYGYVIPHVQHPDALMLYTEPPAYDIQTDNPVTKFIFKLSVHSVDADQLFFVDEGVLAYPGTIYLHRDNFEVLFYSEKDKKVTLLKAETSLPTKGLDKYVSNFKLIDLKSTKKFKTGGIDTLVIDPAVKSEAVLIDRQFNFIKGFFYGVASGLVGGKSDIEVRFSRVLQEMINTFAELKNKADNQSNSGSKYQRSATYQPKTVEVDDTRLRSLIKNASALFGEHFPGRAFSETNLAEFLRTKFSHRLYSLDDAQRYINQKALDDEIFGTDNFQKLKNYYYRHSSDRNPLYYFEMIDRQVDQFMVAVKQSSRSAEMIYEQFKSNIYQLQQFLDKVLLKKAGNKTVDLRPINYNSTDHTIQINEGFKNLSSDLLQEFAHITNILLASPKQGKGETLKDTAVQIVGAVGKASPLYRYLTGELPTYSLDYESSIVAKNFVAFVFNTDSAEKLQNYLETKMIDEGWMAYAFWCTYNGFANTSRNLVKPIFESTNRSLQTYLDKFLGEVYTGIYMRKHHAFDKTVLTGTVSSVQTSPTDQDHRDKSQEFYDQFILGKFKMDLRQFLEAMNQETKEAIIKYLKDHHRVAKKDATKMIDQYREFTSTETLF